MFIELFKFFLDLITEDENLNWLQREMQLLVIA